MPLFLHEPLHPPGEWGLWKIEESEPELRRRLLPTPAEAEQLAAIRGEGRRREFLAARLLLHRMSGRTVRASLVKDDNGKPHLRESDFFVSISHTTDYSAAIAHPLPCGIDVQRIVPRIRRLAGKFVNAAEAAQLTPLDELRQLHLIWSAKEAMYKAYGRRQLDFRENLTVDLPAATARFRRGGEEMLFDLAFRTYDGFVLVGAVAADPNQEAYSG